MRRWGVQNTRAASFLLVAFVVGVLFWSASSWRASTRHNEPRPLLSDTLSNPNPDQAPAKQPRVAKLTTVTGYEDTGFEEALLTHKHHGEVHGYPVYVLREELLGGTWDKLAFLQSILLDELYKPVGKRVEWLMFFDADTVCINPHIPLEIFIPPPDFDHVHLLISQDYNGVNAGTFMLRANKWSYNLLAKDIAYPLLRPDEPLKYHEQTALKLLMEREPGVKNATLFVPKLWFNAYQSDPEADVRGRLLAHFPGPDNKWRMFKWFARLRGDQRGRWELPLEETAYPGEIERFWAALRRAGMVLKGFEKQAKNVPAGIQATGAADAKKEFDAKSEALRKAVEEVTDRPEELERIIGEAVETDSVAKYFKANKRLLATWHDGNPQ